VSTQNHVNEPPGGGETGRSSAEEMDDCSGGTNNLVDEMDLQRETEPTRLLFNHGNNNNDTDDDEDKDDDDDCNS